MMVAFIDRHRAVLGVESICRVLQFAPSAYYERKNQEAKPELRSPRRKTDEALRTAIRRVWDDNFQVYGARKVWRQLVREGFVVARCTVERLMRSMGLQGVVRGKAKRTTISSDRRDILPLDLVHRKFIADRPNQLWVADFTYVATWKGFVYVAFVIDVFSRMIVGWRAATSMSTELTLDALEQALWARQIKGDLIHHSDRGSQYVAIRYTERLLEAGVEASVGSVGDAYDNALAETINGLFKAELIRHRGPWKGIEDVEYATLEWVHWFNTKRLLEPIGYVSPSEFEMQYYSEQQGLAVGAGLN
jgi:transposase InsO family protein